MSTETTKKLDPCGCCEVPVPATPEEIWNRPGKSALDYRVGTFSTFRRAMIEAIAREPRLRDWTARTGDDFGIALLEMWAYVADILTFYQERIANEAYLPTALLREDVLRLAALVDYRPAPGMAATTYMAFTTEEEKTVEIPVGLRVQSVPGQGEQPQKFETVEPVTAESRLNRVRIYPQPEPHNPFEAGSRQGTLDPEYAEEFREGLALEDQLVIFQEGSERVEEKLVDDVETVEDQTVLQWKPAIQREDWGKDRARMFKWTQKFRLFGFDAPQKTLDAEPEGDKSSTLIWKQTDVDFPLSDLDNGQLILDAIYTDIAPGTSVLVVTPSHVNLTKVTEVRTKTADISVFRGTVTQLTLESSVEIASEEEWRETVIYELAEPEIGFWNRRYPDRIRGNTVYVPFDQFSHLGEGRRLILDDAKDDPQLVAVSGIEPYGEGAKVTSDSILPWIEAEQDAITGFERAYVIDDEVIGIKLSSVNLRFWEELGEIHIPVFSAGEVRERGLMSYEDGEILPDLVESWEASEDGLTRIVTLRGGVRLPAYLGITLEDALKRSLDRNTAVFYGNVAECTHGETVADEILGSGDASQRRQSFALRKSPVTFVPRPGAPNGAANTLELRVGGVLWDEVRSLFGHRPDERVYTTDVDDEETMAVNAARLPTGRDNVVATYRKGLGVAGNVGADALKTLLDRPTGLKEGTNPLPARGGADPESLERARANAPNTVRTFGRIVSLRDVEDAAREFAGVAKARARWDWDGAERAVRLTVAGDEGAPVVGEFRQNLVKDLDRRRDPNRKMTVESFSKVRLQVEAALEVHPDAIAAEVQTAAKAALLDHFAFENVDLGQPIHLSNLYHLLQSVEGVIAVDINRLQFKRRSARAPHGATDEPVQARLAIHTTELAVLDEGDAVVSLGGVEPR